MSVLALPEDTFLADRRPARWSEGYSDNRANSVQPSWTRTELGNTKPILPRIIRLKFLFSDGSHQTTRKLEIRIRYKLNQFIKNIWNKSDTRATETIFYNIVWRFLLHQLQRTAKSSTFEMYSHSPSPCLSLLFNQDWLNVFLPLAAIEIWNENN